MAVGIRREDQKIERRQLLYGGKIRDVYVHDKSLPKWTIDFNDPPYGQKSHIFRSNY